MKHSDHSPTTEQAQSQELRQPLVLFFQNWLDRVAQCFFDDDFQGYADAVALPLTVKTDGGAMVVRDLDALREGYDAWLKMMRDNRVTHMIREPVDAVYVTDTKMSGLYETRILADTQQVLPTFTSLMELRLIEGEWCATTVVNGMKNIRWPIDAPVLVPDKDGKA